MSFPNDIFARMFTDKNTQLLYPKEEVQSHDVEEFVAGAEERTRTSTTLRPQAPEACASANSATSARPVAIDRQEPLIIPRASGDPQ